MKKGQYVKLNKLDEAVEAKCKAAHWNSHQHGKDNGDVTSLPVGYWVEGFLLDDINEGSPITLNRRIRNGIVVSGMFSSSPVKIIDGNVVMTDNSKYVVTIEQPKDSIV